jgi:hypothetical protein
MSTGPALSEDVAEPSGAVEPAQLDNTTHSAAIATIDVNFFMLPSFVACLEIFHI